MFEQSLQQDYFLLLQEIDSSPLLTQREASSKLEISLGKANQLISQLIKKGLIEAKPSCELSPKAKKIRYALTSKGRKEREYLMYTFLKVKENEFWRLRSEWRRLKKEQRKNKSEHELSAKRESLLPYLYTMAVAKTEVLNKIF